MTDAHFEELTRRAVRKYHSADTLHLSPDSFKRPKTGARVKPRMSVLSAAAAVALIISFGVFGFGGIQNADDDSLAYNEPKTNTAISSSDFNSAMSTLRIGGKAVTLPLTVGRLSEYAELEGYKKNGSSYTLVFCKKGTDDICFTAIADSVEADSPVRELYVNSSYKGADIVTVLGARMGDEYGSIVEDYYKADGFVRHIPIEAYQNGSAALCRRGENGSAIYFEADDFTQTLSGIKIVFGK